MEFYTTVRKNELLLFVIWLDLTNTVWGVKKPVMSEYLPHNSLYTKLKTSH